MIRCKVCLLPVVRYFDEPAQLCQCCASKAKLRSVQDSSSRDAGSHDTFHNDQR